MNLWRRILLPVWRTFVAMGTGARSSRRSRSLGWVTVAIVAVCLASSMGQVGNNQGRRNNFQNAQKAEKIPSGQ